MACISNVTSYYSWYDIQFGTFELLSTSRGYKFVIPVQINFCSQIKNYTGILDLKIEFKNAYHGNNNKSPNSLEDIMCAVRRLRSGW